MNKSKIIVDSNGKLIIEDANLLFGQYMNFSGRGSQYNREGDRNFNVIIDDPDAVNDLKEVGWNIKIRKPRDEQDDVLHYLKVNVSYRFRGPQIFLHIGKTTNELNEETVGMLDNADIISCDLVINPSHWERPDGTSGISAYLETMHVVAKGDYFADKYATEEV